LTWFCLANSIRCVSRERGSEIQKKDGGLYTRRYKTLLRRAFSWAEELAHQGKSAGDGDPQDVLDEVGALLDSIVNHVGFRFLPGDDRAHVLQKIHSALIALAALALLVRARRTLKAQRGVATRTEARNVARISLALRALDHRPHARGLGDVRSASTAGGFVRNAHIRILEATSCVQGTMAVACGVEVNLSQRAGDSHG
jgi:hypothetical protein